MKFNVMTHDIPIGLRKILKQEFEGNENFISIEFPEESLVLFSDSNSKSDFFFEIKKINEASIEGKTTYTILYKPHNEETLSKRQLNTSLQNFRGYFRKWKHLIVESNKSDMLPSDNITQAYYDELEPYFEILDDDASKVPYSINQQKVILEFLDNLLSNLNTHKNDEVLIKEISDSINETKSNISKLTKKKVVNNIRKIIAKGFKVGIKVGERLLIEFTTELVKKIAIGN